jgi:hypothetical protein
MNHELLLSHLKAYREAQRRSDSESDADRRQRAERTMFYQSWDRQRLAEITEEDRFEYISKLWAMLIWGNKQR